MKRLTPLLRYTLAAAILACAVSAQATILILPNVGGGRIVLTGTTCPKPGFEVLKQAYSYTANGTSIFGCWTLMDGMIHISWDHGDRSIFDVERFTVKDEPVSPKTVPQGRAL